MTIVPYKDSGAGKKDQVAEMFNNISGKYDFLNHFFSLGIDILWRRKVIRWLSKYHPKTILDIATGTGDFAIEALKLKPEKVIGIDISKGMLAVGQEKIRKKGLENKIELKLGDSEDLDFPDNTFDAITAGFGVRNFENLELGISELFRVLKPGGNIAILEFSKPKAFPVKQLYQFYFQVIMPVVGRIVSKDRSAYTYLPESVQRFPEGKEFLTVLSDTGFKDVNQTTLSGGIASIYTGKK